MADGPSDPEHASMLIVRAVVDAVTDAGHDAAPVLEAGQLTLDDLEDVDRTVCFEDEEAVWRAAVEVTADPALGLHAALALRRGRFGALEFAMRHSANLTEAIQRLARFGRLLHGTRLFEFAPRSRGGAALIYHSPHSDDLVEVVGDFALAAVLVTVNDATGTRLDVRAAYLARPAPTDRAAYEAVFGPNVRFDAPQWRLDFSAITLATPMHGADASLVEVLEGYLARDLEALDANASFLARLHDAIRAHLVEGDGSIAAVADELGIGERTLQRRLSELETTYSDELDFVRRELAQRLLARPDVTIEGVALVLGYGEVSSFHRAFRRWTGTTPGRFRRSVS